MILDATNQKQAINEYAKMESNGFWGEEYLLKCVFFLCLFLRKKKVIWRWWWGCLRQQGEKKKFYICLSSGIKQPKR